MRSRFFMFPPVEGAEASYVVWHPKSAAPTRTTERPGASDQVVVFVPGTDAVMHRTRLPNRRAADLLRAATFAIEDELAVPAERTHVVVSEQQDSAGMRSIYAVDVDLMTTLVAELHDRGLDRCHLVPELSILPESDVLYDFGDRMLGSVDRRAIAVDESWPEDVRTAVLRANTRNIERVADPLLQLAQWAGHSSAFADLRQGIYATSSSKAFSLGALRTPALLAMALAVVSFLDLGLSVRAMENLEGRLRSTAANNFVATFGEDAASGDLAAAAKAKLAAAPEIDNDFVSMTALLYSALESAPGVTITSLRYDRDRGELSADLTYPAFGTDAEVKTAAEAQGAVVRLGDTGVENGLVVGDLTLELRP